jgi:transposase
MNKEVIEYFLPAELLKYFTIIRVEEKLELSGKEIILEIELEEKNELPSGYDKSQYESKGFLPMTRIQDFPIRGKAVYLLIKRRRWRDKTNKNEVIQNDYTLIAEGSKLTRELSDFLKGTGRDPGRYH